MLPAVAYAVFLATIIGTMMLREMGLRWRWALLISFILSAGAAWSILSASSPL